MNEEDVIGSRYKTLLKNKWTILLILILLFSFGARIWVFNMTKDQAVWWDAADYLTGAKVIGKQLDINYQFDDRRPFFLAAFWGAIYFFGGEEIALRLTELIFSIVGVYLSYLVGKKLYNEKIGLISAFGMGVFWIHLFFTGRLMTGVPATTFWLAGLYYFIRGYINKEGSKYIYISGIFFGLMMFTKANFVLGLFALLAYLLLTEKLNFLKKKELWIMCLVILLILSPFIIFVQQQMGNAFVGITGVGEGRFLQKEAEPPGTAFVRYIAFFPTYLQWPFLVLFLIGCYMLLEMVLGFDLLLKGKSKKLKKTLLLILWCGAYFTLFGFLVQPMIEPRYLMPIFPAIFMIMGHGVLKVYDLIKKYNKEVALVVVFGLLLFGGYSQLKYTNNAIRSKVDSYLPVKEAGLWIRANSDSNEGVASASLPQTWYYAERSVVPFSAHGTTLDDVTIEMFEANLSYYNVNYIMVSVFEPMVPEWSFTYCTDRPNEWEPVNGWFADEAQTQPLLIIYKRKEV